MSPPTPTTVRSANVSRGLIYLVRFEPVGPRVPGGHKADLELASNAMALLELDAIEGQVLEDGALSYYAQARTDGGFELPIEVAEVPGWGWTGGAPGSPGFAVAQSYPGRLRIARITHQRGTSARTRTGAGVSTCKRLEPRAGAYAVARGVRYRALVSLATHFTAESVTKYLLEHGWSGVRLYEPPEPLPADWPATPPDAGALEDGRRWIHGEAVREGEDTTIDVVSTLHKILTIHLSVYRVAAMWACDTAAPSVSAPSAAPAPAATHPEPLPRIGLGPGPAGLDAELPPAIAPSVVHAWQTETDPEALRRLAATMRQGGFSIASNLLDQQALYAESASRAAERAVEKPKRSQGRTIALGLAVVGTLAALVRR